MSVLQVPGDTRVVIENPANFGRVAVLLGGDSAERDVSLDTGAAVTEALQSKGVDAIAWDPSERPLVELSAAGIDRAWIALHGPGGEDGSVQGALEWLHVPYTGSGVAASAIAMDKVRSKHLFRAVGLPTPDYHVIEDRAQAVIALEDLGLPLIVKPAGQGSSVGMSKVFELAELNDAVDLALAHGDLAIVEQCVIGDEMTVGVLQGEALPTIRIETPRVFYDYRAKYESDRTEYFCPGARSEESEQRHRELALAAFALLGCTGWGRVDFMTAEGDEPQILEINTVPGMTSHSLVPMAARQSGIDFAELCWRILETTFNDAALNPAATELKGVANGA